MISAGRERRGPGPGPGLGDRHDTHALRASLREVGRADGIAAVRRLSGGVIADAWLITWADGTSAVGKIVNGAAPDLCRTEADGLAALRVSCSAASRTSARPRPMTWGGSATPSACSTSTDPRRRC